jgi:uncharacterized membrane protein YkoI
MLAVVRLSIAALLTLAVVSACARAEEAAVHPPRTTAPAAPTSAAPSSEASHACLTQKERRALVENGTVVHLAVAMHALKNRVSGALVRARLCRRPDGLVYVLTVLGHDGKVSRAVVDAVKGTLVGGL